MKKLMVTFFVILTFVVAPGVSFAGDASPWTEEDGYGNQVMHKLDYGVKNLLGGWTELFRQPMAAKDNDENCFSAFGQGIYNTIVYSVGGALHTATFLIPDIDIPIKDGGVQF